MLRKEEAELRAKKEEAAIQQLQDAHWVASENEAKGYYLEIILIISGLSLDDSFIFSRKTGRRSFGKFNPQIEVK